MSTLSTLTRTEFTLLGRNRVLLVNAVVMPLIFPIALLILGRRDGLTDKGVAAALEVFAMFLLVFVVFYNLLSVYATRRDELVLKRLRTGESTDAQILLGPAVPSFVLTGLLTLIVGTAVVAFGGGMPVNAILVVVALACGAALFTALALITSAFTRNAEAAQITCMPIVLVALAGTSFVRDTVPESFQRIVDLTPMAAALDLLNLGWFGTTNPGDEAAGFADTFASAGMPLLVVAAWLGGSLLVARTHFRWEPRA